MESPDHVEKLNSQVSSIINKAGSFDHSEICTRKYFQIYTAEAKRTDQRFKPLSIQGHILESIYNQTKCSVTYKNPCFQRD